MPKVVNGLSRKFVYDGYGARGPIYIVLVVTHTQLIFFNYIIYKLWDSEKMNGKYFAGDPLTHLCNQSNIPA